METKMETTIMRYIGFRAAPYAHEPLIPILCTQLSYRLPKSGIPGLYP